MSSMIRKTVCLASLVLAPALVFSSPSAVRADGDFVVGVRGGPSWVLSKVGSGKDADSGGHVNLHGGYRIAKPLLIGVMLDGERHGLKDEAASVHIGDAYTFSVLPFAEARLDMPGSPLVPFANLAIGVNFNYLDKSNSGLGATNMKNKEAYRFGAGCDFVLADTFVLTGEVAYKVNDTTLKSAAVTAINGDTRLNSFSFLVGGRLIF